MNNPRLTQSWRFLNVGNSERARIRCSDCGEAAYYCHQWQSDQMAAPAFYYYCREHTAKRGGPS